MNSGLIVGMGRDISLVMVVSLIWCLNYEFWLLFVNGVKLVKVVYGREMLVFDFCILFV